ncbi:MAG: carboxypeptidase regulatory-like domain-containing protein, partial [Pyrinomonadaceae bacterium]
MGFLIKEMRSPGHAGLLLILISAVLFAAPNAAAKEPVPEMSGKNLGIIKGIVRDEGGNPIADASVAIFRAGTTKLLKQVSSGRDGSFLARILPGKYSVLAVAQGFNPSTVFGVEVGQSAELVYRFSLERAGSGNTLPEKRADKNSSKWRIRAAQMQRAIYQNREGKTPIDTTATADADELVLDDAPDRKGQIAVETYFAGTKHGNYAGVNFATLVPMGDDAEAVLAAQVAKGANAPQRFETAVTFRPVDNHQFRLNASAGRFGNVHLAGDDKSLGQFSFQALDEWKVREGIIVVFGLDYSRFLGAGDDSVLSPRLGFQYDLNSRTRLRTSLTSQTEERSWARAIDLEGQNIAFTEPVAIEDLYVEADKPRMNNSRRLELGIERVLDNSSSVEANVFLDTTFGRGVGLNAMAFDTLSGDGFGDFVANQQGRTQGIRVVYTRRINGLFSTSAGYSFGNGQRLSPRAITDPSNVFENDFFQSFFAQISTDLSTGTSVRTIYRLSPQATVFAIDPFKGRLAIYDPGM